jgi:hypothetical protein
MSLAALSNPMTPRYLLAQVFFRSSRKVGELVATTVSSLCNVFCACKHFAPPSPFAALRCYRMLQELSWNIQVLAFQTLHCPYRKPDAGESGIELCLARLEYHLNELQALWGESAHIARPVERAQDPDVPVLQLSRHICGRSLNTSLGKIHSSSSVHQRASQPIWPSMGLLEKLQASEDLRSPNRRSQTNPLSLRARVIQIRTEIYTAQEPQHLHHRRPLSRR